MDRRRERKRSDRQGENERLRGRRRVRDKHGEGRRVDCPAERADQIFKGRPQRSADARLRHHDRRQHGPQSMQRQVESVNDGEGEQAGDRHAQAKAQFVPMSADMIARAAPEGRDFHAQSALRRGRTHRVRATGWRRGSGR